MNLKEKIEEWNTNVEDSVFESSGWNTNDVVYAACEIIGELVKSQPKYELGQEVWFRFDKSIGMGLITAIKIISSDYEMIISYYLSINSDKYPLQSDWCDEYLLFGDKEELLNSL